MAKREKTATKGIYKRGSRYDVSYRDAQGRQHWKSARTLTEARALQATLKADVARGEHRELSRAGFGAYAAEWIETYEGRTGKGVRGSTMSDYRRDVLNRAVPHFGKMRLVEIEPRHLKAFAKSLRDEGLADTTVRRIMAPLKALLATAKEEGLIRSNPAEGIRLAGGKSERGEEIRALSEEELARVLAEAPERWRLLFDFLAQTGLRIGEACELRWSDVDLGTGRLMVHRGWYKGNVADPKSSKGKRTVPLGEGLTRKLWEHRKAGGGKDDDFVFAGDSGRRMQQANVRERVLKPAALRAGIASGEEGRNWVAFHTFRHTCASRFFRAGANAKQVSELLGHSDPGFTLRTYVHLLPDDLPDPSFLDVLAPNDPASALGGNKVVTEATESSRNARTVKSA